MNKARDVIEKHIRQCDEVLPQWKRQRDEIAQQVAALTANITNAEKDRDEYQAALDELNATAKG